MLPKIAFRTDSSVEMGAGHVMRCLALADELQRRGAMCHFICRAHDGHMGGKILQHGHSVSLLQPVSDAAARATKGLYSSWLGCEWEKDAEQTRSVLSEAVWTWLVVDHYAIDWRWEGAMQGCAEHLMAIDDLANRRHEVSLLVDQNLGRDAACYRDLLPSGARCLIGPAYALLRREFHELRHHSLLRRRNSSPKQLLVSLGGMDAENVTGRVLDVLATTGLPEDIQVVVVLGSAAPALDAVVRQGARMPFHCDVCIDVRNMAKLMMESDVAIGAAGGSSWERCVLGLPSLMIVLADNQRDIASALDLAGAGILLPNGNLRALGHTVLSLLADPERLSRISKLASEQCDGLGAARVVNEMLAGVSS